MKNKKIEKINGWKTKPTTHLVVEQAIKDSKEAKMKWEFERHNKPNT